MCILITGATGFVGGALARRLADEGREPHLFVRSGADRRRLAGLRGIVEHDVDLRDGERVAAAVRTILPRVIYHCAVYGGFSVQNDRPGIFRTNLDGTINLLAACEEVGFDRFVNTGSSSEYGIKSAPMCEYDLPEPRGDYGVAKCAATLHCRSEALLKGLPVVTLRLFSPYGPWDDPRRFIPSVARKLLDGGLPEVRLPRAVRDYIYIDDVLELYRLVTELPVVPGEILNGGSGSQVRIGEVAEQLRLLTGGAAILAGDGASPRPEPECWVASTDKVRSLLGWTPQVNLAEGLALTVAWMREHPDFR
jgi:nucleoside-diphosphate-sugar epimerase